MHYESVHKVVFGVGRSRCFFTKFVLLLLMRVPNNSGRGRVSSPFGAARAFVNIRLT